MEKYFATFGKKYLQKTIKMFEKPKKENLKPAISQPIDDDFI
jgi:hypothetical protein